MTIASLAESLARRRPRQTPRAVAAEASWTHARGAAARGVWHRREARQDL